jgi:thiol-disulfide isomerase/thioredoxin
VSQPEGRAASARPKAARALLAAALLGLAGCGPGENGDGPAPLGLAPDFTLPLLDGGSVTLSELRGKTVIVDFWATWCPPCVFQVPELNRLHAVHREAGDVVVIGVAVDVDGAEAVGPWVEEQKVEYQIALGDEDLAVRFGAVGFPTLVVVTPDGHIDSLHVGLIEYDELEALVARLNAPRAS